MRRKKEGRTGVRGRGDALIQESHNSALPQIRVRGDNLSPQQLPRMEGDSGVVVVCKGHEFP
jgi:hypothetical protein